MNKVNIKIAKKDNVPREKMVIVVLPLNPNNDINIIPKRYLFSETLGDP